MALRRRPSDWSSDEWAQINALLDEALDLPLDERCGWLDALTGDAREMRSTLQRLLGLANAGGDPERPLQPPHLDADHSDGGFAPDVVIGGYRLIRLLGQGGMGSVWLATRIDGSVPRPVALKLPNSNRGGAELSQRMARERDVLAGLEHANIARLYDAGVSNGQPYLALEFVAGLPIDDYVEKRGLSVDAILRLFMQVAEAVAHAHGKLVVHRDIKPANVLVTDDARVALLDFGIAKLLGEGAADATALTREGGSPLTPRYAAPEQLVGGPITVATDVYALGVLLYELLAKTHPHASETARANASNQRALGHDPPAPSQAVSDPRTARTLRGEIDTIVQKCLKESPSERYPSVAALGQDIERYLRGYPILARPDSPGYRLRKFVARNPVPLGAVVLAVIAVLTASAMTHLQLIEIRKQRDAALFQHQRVSASNEFYSLLLSDVGLPDTPLTPLQLLDQGLAMLERQFDGDDRFLGRLYYDLALRFAELGVTNRQVALLERAEQLATRHADHDVSVAAACAIASAQLVSDPEAAKERWESVRAKLSVLPDFAVDARFSCARLEARLLERDQKRNEAISLLEKVLTDLEDSAALSPHALSLAVADLGLMVYNDDHAAEALGHIDHAIAISERGGRSRTLSHQIFRANKATVLGTGGEYRAQAEIWDEIMAAAESWHEVPIQMLAGYATSLAQVSRRDEALRMARLARERAGAAGNDVAEAMAHLTIGKQLAHRGDFADVGQHFDKAERLLGSNPQTFRAQLAALRLARAETLYAQGRLREALSLVESLLVEWGYPESLDHAGIGHALALRVKIALYEQEFEAALHYADDLLKAALRKAIEPTRSADVGRAHWLRAQALQGDGDISRALQDSRASLPALSTGLGAGHEDTRAAKGLLDELERIATHAL